MVEITPLDDVFVRVDASTDILRELSEYFTFETPGSAYMRRQAQYRKWDGRIRLFKLRTQTIYRGLVPRIIEFAQQRDYEVVNRVPTVTSDWTPEALNDFLQSLNLPFVPRDYQINGLRKLLRDERGICLSPTGSGKSFIIYLLTQVLGVKTLIVVPTIGLVSQMAKDFKGYGYDLHNMHTIQAGKEKNAAVGLYISTWQSIYKLPGEYFNQFECIIVDEVHQAKSKSLSHLLEKATTVRYRFGFTGTLDETQAHQLILEGLFGEVTRVATTSDLIKQKQLAPLRVRMVMLKYPEPECKLNKRAQYQDEIEYIVTHQARLEFTAQLVSRLKGNVLVLFNFIDKHGIPLHELITKRCVNKQVHYIAGSVTGDERETIREFVQENDDQVINASYGTFSMGVNITNLRHVVFASPSKSKIRVLQSLGRGLRMEAGKMNVTLWDIVDDLRVGKRVNFAVQHAEQRALYYSTEKFPMTIQEVSLDSFSVNLNANV